jgi:trimeric autotransporter adhesin
MARRHGSRLLAIVLVSCLCSHVFAAPEDSRWSGELTIYGGLDGYASALLAYDGGIAAAGRFSAAGGIAAANVAFWNRCYWLPLGGGLDFEVAALAQFRGGLVAAGLRHTGASTTPAVAILSGGVWKAIGSFEGIAVRALLVRDGLLIAGGEFGGVDGAPVRNIACWDGKDWRGMGTELVGPVRALLEWRGDLYAGGAFHWMPGYGPRYLARWTGAKWEDAGLDLKAPVFALAEHGDRLIAGGDFAAAGEAEVNYVVAWDGTSCQPLGTGIEPGDSPVVSALVSYRGELIAGGSFERAGFRDVWHIAAWTGTWWQPLGDGVDPTSPGGDAESGGFAPTPAFAPLDPLLGMTASAAGSHSVRALMVWDDRLYVGGSFSMADSVRSPGIAVWGPLATGQTPPPELLGRPFPTPASGDVCIPLFLREDAVLTAWIADAQGRWVMTLSDRALHGPHLLRWDGTDRAGNIAPAGVYYVRVECSGTETGTRKIVIVR